MRKHNYIRIIKCAVSLALVFAVSVSGISLPDIEGKKISTTSVAKAATVTDRLPIVTYTRYSANLRTYTDSSLRTRTGYICSGDKCTILELYSNGAAKVRYPVSRGMRTAYANMCGFFLNVDFSTVTTELGVGKTAYRKSTGNSTIGSVYANDQVVIVGSENGRTEVIYPTSSGYKMGWVSGTYGVRNEPATTPAQTVESQETIASKMVAYELSQLGVGDYRGNNNVIYNKWYWGRTVCGAGYAWCMAFQAYCCNQITGANDIIPRTASCTSAVNKFKSWGRFQYSNYYGGNYTPKAGDLVFYTTNKGRTSCHVGMIVASPVKGYLQTVEGNIQCSDGNWKVVKFIRNAKRTIYNSYVLGYGIPNY